MHHAQIALAALVFSTLACSALRAEEPVLIDSNKAAQLRRLEPLTTDKINVFREAGQLTNRQAEFIRKHVTADGKLALPESAIGREPVRVAPPPPAPAGRETRVVQSSTNPYARFNYNLSAAERDSLTRAIRDFRHGNREEIGRVLRQARPQVNELVAASYPDPIDLPIKVALWSEVAGPANPDAVIGLFDTHRAAYELARPVLIPYAKDVGGIIVRRKSSMPDWGGATAQRWITSRELREMIIDIEGMIARCPGPNAAIFLMGVYSQRYGGGEAPMRDDGRDWRRMVEACGGNPKQFEDDDSKTWSSTLSPADRAMIADALIPWITRGDGDRRRIARNAMLVCIQTQNHPDWDASRAEWERWWKDQPR
ncbi:MAG TPA: hypothetical protein VGP72_11725 [Planctomycetota bacterium]|jgi:uncharacterized membrane protein